MDVVSAIKTGVVIVKADFLCLVHALINAMEQVNGGPKYKFYRNGKFYRIPVLI